MLSKLFYVTFLIIAVLIAVASTLFALEYYTRWKEATVFPLNINHFVDVTNIATSSPRYPLLILFGNSRVVQWKPEPDISNFVVINRGISGETTEQMKYRFQKDVLSLKPKLVVIQAGINDLAAIGALKDKEEVILANLKNNFKYFIHASNNAGVRIIVSTIIRPASPEWYRRIVWSSRIPILVDNVNDFLRKLASNENFELLDADKILAPTQAPLAAPYAKDTLHLKQQAYKVLNIKLLEMVQ